MLIVAGGVGWNDSVATVTAPPSTVVSFPPLIVLRVAQPEASESRARMTVSRNPFGIPEAEMIFMGSGQEGR